MTLTDRQSHLIDNEEKTNIQDLFDITKTYFVLPNIHINQCLHARVLGTHAENLEVKT